MRYINPRFTYFYLLTTNVCRCSKCYKKNTATEALVQYEINFVRLWCVNTKAQDFLHKNTQI